MTALPAAAIAELQAALDTDRSVNASLALVVFEYLITLEHEWSFLSARRWTAVTWIFLLNRYLMLAVAIQKAPVYSVQECQDLPLNIFLDIIAMLPFAVTAIFSALRVFALMDHNILVSGIVLVLSLVPVGTNSYAFSRTTQIYVNNPVTGSSCVGVVSVDAQTNLALALSTRLAVIIADIIVLVVTWGRTFDTVKRAGSAGVSVSISRTILQDGSIYFIIMLGLNVFLMVCNAVSVPEDFLVPVILSDAMQPLLVSRFLINLRGIETVPEYDTGTRDPLQTTTVNFRIPTIQSVIGNIGETLYNGIEEPSEESTISEDSSGALNETEDA